MKEYTEKDLHILTPDFPHLYSSDNDLVEAPLWWHTKGLQQTATGYGRKLTTSRKIHYNGKLYRIYCTCFSNAGSCWFVAKNRKIYVS